VVIVAQSLTDFGFVTIAMCRVVWAACRFGEMIVEGAIQTDIAGKAQLTLKTFYNIKSLHTPC